MEDPCVIFNTIKDFSHDNDDWNRKSRKSMPESEQAVQINLKARKVMNKEKALLKPQN